mmetsp:Transcript_883/g.2050  ORF Transcript_883/g.2050 Transcript_883/m.2050 type:complete len:510 (-) Transcript_883:168-1697(-)
MFAFTLEAVDLDVLEMARTQLEQCLVAETGTFHEDTRTGKHDVHLKGEHYDTSEFSLYEDEASDLDVDENKYHGNDRYYDHEFASSPSINSPTSIAERRARGMPRSSLDRVVEIRMQCMALRIMISLLLRYGLVKFRCELLRLGAELMELQADAGVANASEVYFTDINVVQFSCALAQRFDGETELQPAEAYTQYRSCGRGHKTKSNIRKVRANSTSSSTSAHQPKHENREHFNTEEKLSGYSAGPPTHLRIDPRPPMQQAGVYSPASGALRNRIQEKQKRFIRSRILTSAAAAHNRKTPKSQPLFQDDRSWAQQLRSSKPSPPTSPSGDVAAQTGLTTSAAISAVVAAAIQGSSKIGDSCFTASELAAMSASNVSISSSAYLKSLGRSRTPTAQELGQLHRGGHASPSSSLVESVLQKALTPTSLRTMSVDGGRSSRRRSRERSNSDAALRRRMSQAYGNFYSQQNARKQAERARQIQVNAESMMSNLGASSFSTASSMTALSSAPIH